ncbi:NUDIX domain-containing protein [Streptomyces purpureus]|uniref:NUDIX hydrolase n=1 Tax=Streptomyces purpureus TaxID=1951 RepID=A0A918LP90_9ACTN|nr:NUDIX hydrolase [Streptomyces purpureus]GGT29680.1 NUDIX hydrolase [Streptomyces purpureus]
MTNTWLPPAEYIATLPKVTAYACLYFTDTHGRPFQLKARYGTERWQWPGGNMDPGETLWQTAVRECREETGIVFDGEPRLLGAHFNAPAGDDWPATHVGFIFDGGTLTDAQLDRVVLDPEEHTEYRVCSLDEWERTMTPGNFARLAQVDRARRSGEAVYMETGSFA